MQGKIIDFVQKSEKVAIFFICLSTSFTPRRQSNFRTYGQQIAHHTSFGKQHSIPIATTNSFAGVPTAGHTSDDLAACHLLFNVLSAATAAFRRPISHKSNKECRFQNFSRQVARILLQFTKFCATIIKLWGHSSVGRALEWHSRGQGSDSPCLHQKPYQKSLVLNSV